MNIKEMVTNTVKEINWKKLALEATTTVLNKVLDALNEEKAKVEQEVAAAKNGTDAQ